MKRLWLKAILLALPFSWLAVFGLAGEAAAATTITVKISIQGSSASNLTVTLNRVDNNDPAYPVHYTARYSGGSYVASNVACTTDPTTNEMANGQNPNIFTLSSTGSASGSKQIEVDCKYNGYTYNTSLSVQAQTAQNPLGGVKGRITFTDPDNNKTVAFGDHGTPTLSVTGPTNVGNISVDSNGNFNTQNTLKDGDYTLTGTEIYNPPNATSQFYKVTKKFTVTGTKITDLGTLTATKQASSVQQTPDPQAGQTDPKNDCDTGSAAVNWIICDMIIHPIENAVDDMAGFTASLLQEEPLTAAGNNKPVHDVWSAFRNIADVLFIMAFMVVVFGSAIGLSADAYTIKKVLPRLVAAAILVQFSFFIGQVLVDLGNILGRGVQELFNTALSLPNGTGFEFHIKLTDGTQAATVAAAAAIAVAAGVGAAVGLSSVVLIGALIAIIATIFTLIVRKAFILLLVVLSPVAFIAWILPNTEKYFKMWWTNLLKLIMMFPLVMGLFGMGKLFAVVAPAAFTGGVAWMGALAAIVGYVMPLFMVPMMFKSAGGLMNFAAGAIGGFAAGRSKALQGSKWAEKRAEERQRNNIAKATDPNAGFLKKAIASNRAGFGFRPSSVQQLKMRKAQDAMEAELNSGAARQLRDKDAYNDADVEELRGHLNGQDAALRKAAAEKLIKAGNYKALFNDDGSLKEGVSDSPELREVIRGEAGTIISKAPQALLSGKALDDHFESISADEIASLSASGHQAYQTYLRTRASDKGKANATIQFKGMGPAAVGRLKGTERSVYDDEFKFEFAGSKAAEAAKAPAPVGPGGSPIILDDDADGDAHI